MVREGEEVKPKVLRNGRAGPVVVIVRSNFLSRLCKMGSRPLLGRPSPS